MTLAEAETGGATEAVHIAGDASSLAAIAEERCAAAIWLRRLPTEVRSWIEAFDARQFPSERLTLQPDAVEGAVKEAFAAAGLPDCAERRWLQSDIGSLALRFADLMGAPYLRVRFSAVTNNSCRKFHVDAITARLICTYRGSGTQYGLSKNGADPQHVHKVATGDAIVLRGSLWPERPRSGLVHRSPPIEGTGETRFLLVIDPASGPDEPI